jgi:Flp pilus assembly protein TadB
MNEANKCPNCGQYKLDRRSTLIMLLIAVGAAAILIITLPLEIVLVPAAIVAAIVPSMRATYRYCRNCRWTDRLAKTTA